MSKGKPKVNFHYGQEDIEKLMKKIIKYKLQESNIKDNEGNNSNNHTITIYCEKAER